MSLFSLFYQFQCRKYNFPISNILKFNYVPAGKTPYLLNLPTTAFPNPVNRQPAPISSTAIAPAMACLLNVL